ncbi:MAG TPA: hypothetical protein VJ935_10810, partial [Acidimicrobiia bacterium]|nr:hypothetical protein [Acidimicrobiia bacterium]
GGSTGYNKTGSWCLAIAGYCEAEAEIETGDGGDGGDGGSTGHNQAYSKGESDDPCRCEPRNGQLSKGQYETSCGCESRNSYQSKDWGCGCRENGKNRNHYEPAIRTGEGGEGGDGGNSGDAMNYSWTEGGDGGDSGDSGPAISNTESETEANSGDSESEARAYGGEGGDGGNADVDWKRLIGYRW